MIEGVWSWLCHCCSDMIRKKMEISNHQCPKAVQIGADAINAATWTMLWNMCVARRFPAQPLLMCFMIYVSTDTFYLSASSIKVIFLLMIQSLTPPTIERLHTANISCINMVIWEGVSEKSFLLVWFGRFGTNIQHLIIST